jgi:hypothetical protein
MGDELRWRHPPVCAQDPPRANGVAYSVRSKAYIEEATDDRAILCDCHCGPMYYFPVSLMSTSDFVMCWVADCGRCYNKSLGYFRLGARKATISRIDEASRRMMRCPTQNCPASSSMAVARCNDASDGEDETRWHCFECGAEFHFHKFGTLWRRLLRSFAPLTHQRPSVKH